MLRFRQRIYLSIIGTLTVIMLIMAVLQVRAISRMGGSTVEETMRPALVDQAEHTALLESEKNSKEIDRVLYALSMLSHSYAKSIAKEYSVDLYIPGYTDSPTFWNYVEKVLQDLKNSDDKIINVYYADFRGTVKDRSSSGASGGIQRNKNQLVSEGCGRRALLDGSL